MCKHLFKHLGGVFKHLGGGVNDLGGMFKHLRGVFKDVINNPTYSCQHIHHPLQTHHRHYHPHFHYQVKSALTSVFVLPVNAPVRLNIGHR
jgi:hypothetical protein